MVRRRTAGEVGFPWEVLSQQVDGEARMPFHQGCDVTVGGAAEQIALPVARNGAVFNLCRSFSDRDGIDDLTLGLSASSSMP